jgi:hypothetical protein
VGKGAGTGLPDGRTYRTPCPPITHAKYSMVGPVLRRARGKVVLVARTFAHPTRLKRSSSRRGGRLLAACLRHALLIERYEINRIEQERGEAAVAHRRCDHLAREWE